MKWSSRAENTLNMHPVPFVSVSHFSFVHAGEIPIESSVCPYCIYNHQLCDSENTNEQTQDQHCGYNNSCHPNSPGRSSSQCHFSSPCHGDTQPPEPKRRIYERCWAGLRTKLDVIVSSRYFNRGIMIAILINTLSMGIEYHEQVCLCVSVPEAACLCVHMHSKWYVIAVWLKIDVLIMWEAKPLNSPPNQHSVFSGIWDHTHSGCVRVHSQMTCMYTCNSSRRNS